MGITQTITNIFNAIVDPLLGPLLKLGPFWAIFILSLVIAILTTIIYKAVTDQKRMKQLKDQTKALQKEIKAVSKTDPNKAMKLQKKMLGLSKEQMKSSFKPTLITILPLLLIFGWLNGNMGYYPLQAGEEFTTTIQFDENVNGTVAFKASGLEVLSDAEQAIGADGKVQWKLKGDPGAYDVEYTFSGKTYTKDLVIKKNGHNGYTAPVKAVKDGLVNTISIDMRKIVILNLFGWRLGWLGAYILFSIVFSMGFRKILKVY